MGSEVKDPKLRLQGEVSVCVCVWERGGWAARQDCTGGAVMSGD